MRFVRPLVRRLVSAIRNAPNRRAPMPAGACGRRAVILHFDGVGRRTLDLAMRQGRFPFLQRLLQSGTHAVSTYRVGAPASTAAFQAGLLFGRADDVPGYLWYDKRLGRNMRMDRSADVTLVEARQQRDEPGLLAGGRSYATLFGGGAKAPTMNLSCATHLDLNLGGRWPQPLGAFVIGALVVKLAARLLVAIPRDLVEGIRWCLTVGSIDHEWRLFCMRALTDTMREITSWSLVADMAGGTPIVYACVVDYDENAHRRGPLAERALRHLDAADKAAEIVYAAAEALPGMNYDVYVLADHGQVESVPFSTLQGQDLAAFLRSAVGEEPAAKGTPPPGVEIVDAGDIAHLYFTDTREAQTLEEIERRRPAILAALQTSESVPFLAVRSDRGPVVLAGRRYYHLAEAQSRLELAEVPAFRGPHRELLIGYVERLIGMQSAGDLILYGNRGAGERAVAFSWEWGSHGGIGIDEVEAFVLHPANVAFDFGAVTLPCELFRWFVRYRPGASQPVERPVIIERVVETQIEGRS